MAKKSQTDGKRKKTRTAAKQTDGKIASEAGSLPGKRVSFEETLKPPPGGAAVRMYRIGHGDCFLIAFDGENEGKPVHVLIDCGYKPGSPGKLDQPTRVKEIGEHIIATTGGFIDVGVVTHEHQDHVNGLTSGNFAGLKVGKVWFAWTESPTDEVAKQLRKKFGDRLLGLIDTRANLLGLGKADSISDLEQFLEMELGESPDGFNGVRHLGAAGRNPSDSANKIAMKFLRECAPGKPEYLYPHGNAIPVPGAKSARVFALGPPHDADKIDDLDPIGDETFGDDHAFGSGGGRGATITSPFSRRHVIPLEHAIADPNVGSFFADFYGEESVSASDSADGKEIPSNANWRRLGTDDAAEAGSLALAMNNATNNSSLVLAFELSKGGKVLLFVGDAQAGNWRSWSEDSFDDNGTNVTAEDLLGRTVLYKVGHHGSHNATLKGREGSREAGLAIMAKGKYADEFVAMITAVEAWAHQKPKPDWNHPFPAIKDALVEKARGRVLQTDSAAPSAPINDTDRNFQSFQARVKETPLYFDLIVYP